MKLLRYGPAGQEKPGLLDASGTIRDLSGHLADIYAAGATPAALARVARIDPTSLPTVAGQPRLGVPVRGIGKFIAIGLNNADHAAESNMAIPAEPIIFTKAISCLSGPDDDVILPKDSFLDVNGRRMQTGNTRTMIFSVRQLIAYVSRCITLCPGDLLITGTPPGVGMGMKPRPVYLKEGDVMTLGIDGLGQQRQRVVPRRKMTEELTP